jgi:hypothetical protein
MGQRVSSENQGVCQPWFGGLEEISYKDLNLLEKG